MKKTFLLSLCLSFLFSATYAQKVVRVKTVDEFVKAIASNTVIVMEYGLYNLSPYNTIDKSGEYEVSGFQIHNINNLTIKGIGKFPSELVLDGDVYATVLRFVACKGITLENIEVGHGAMRGACQGAVIGLINTQNVIIRKSVLYGSGIYGIESDKGSSDILCENSTIRSCTYGAISLTQTNNVTFTNTYFTDNGDLDIFYINECQNVVFNTCIIKDNRSNATEYSNQKLFAVTGAPITLNNCLVKFNSTDHFANQATNIRNNGSVIEGNLYYRTEYEK